MKPIYITIQWRNYNSKHGNKSIIIPPKTDPIYHNFHLHNNYHNHHHLRNIAKWKDQRIELVDISKGLIEILQDVGFTIEKILDSEPSDIAEILGIDDYIGELIYQETKKSN
ncbi:MAG TPA: hypothetical protein VFP49_02380 [Nitrososphaeraceae archaeon]|nr:hypothetical protein [Nitrososphaeraceae archaeon]